MRQTHWGRMPPAQKKSRIWTEPVAACAYMNLPTDLMSECVRKSVFVLVNDAQWM